MHVNPRVFRGFSTLRHRLHTQSSKKSICSSLFASVSKWLLGGPHGRGRQCALLLLLLVALGTASITFFFHSYYLARVHELEQALARAKTQAAAGQDGESASLAGLGASLQSETGVSRGEQTPGQGEETLRNATQSSEETERQAETKETQKVGSPLPSWWKRRPATGHSVSGGVWDASVSLSLFDLKEQIRASSAAGNPGEKTLVTHGLGIVLLLPSSPALSSSVGRTLQDLLSLRNAFPGKKLFPVIISQPGSSVWQASAVGPFRVGSSAAYHMQFDSKKRPLSRSPSFEKSQADPERDSASSQRETDRSHLLWAGRQVFDELGLPFAIFLDADLEVSPDFFSFLEKAVDVLAAEEGPGCASPFSALSVSASPGTGAQLAALQARLWRSSSLPPFALLLSRSAFSWFEQSKKEEDQPARGEEEKKPESFSCLVPVLPRCRKSSSSLGVSSEWRPLLARHRFSKEFFEWQKPETKEEAQGGVQNGDHSSWASPAFQEAAFEKELETSLENATPIAISEVASLQPSNSSIFRIFYPSESELRYALGILLGETLPSFSSFPRSLLSSDFQDLPGMYKGVVYVELPGVQVYLHGAWPARFAGK
ncbi:Alpha-1,3-mannosyl-glycoprotein 2-beta-N-acetylglucosaminyltransferase [Toxoplasma gondii VEG]|uniref:Alpha-1,3-mannosyl-glycoprotein 2-beta-N-acetylglucosaminyltransferase n=1 Tax=Toxoplasma gondii (strain ATCC 50861 / VEG) TaxID=432359 RepID=V4ZMX5_TOXGV|nr:Alpha-1,3-mannosyl-glycoprotein 2-beta-N-acetylglucosaminyltransferase [Toxoplasma gondii VEG]CEL75695.1 TPA: Alpha-1,3-mannosyl-glycoprotein 2-beta-N-acetylglucosaminyltransferase [Toxoplasma gondii VEG]